jgi:AraC-like DNA-binding protein
LSVKEIMNRVGLSDESHFVHEFKKTYGLAPSKYRRANVLSSSMAPRSFHR